LAYIVTSAIGWLLFGRLGDIFGRRWLDIGGNLISLIGVIIAATAPNLNALITSNVFIGLGAAVQLSYGTVVQELVPYNKRGLMAAFILTFVVPGAVFGPVIAKGFQVHTSAGWRWNYYLSIIVNGIALVLLFIYYHPPNFEMLHIGKSKWAQVKALDYGGMFLFIAGEVLFLIGINWGGGLYPWKSARVIACIIVGFFMIIIFVAYEAYVPADPLIPISLVKNLQFTLFVWFACVGGMLYYALGIVWPTTVATLFTTDLMHQGYLTLAQTGGNQFGNVLCGLAFASIGRVKYQLMIASVIW
jgi:MFS family permease